MTAARAVRWHPREALARATSRSPAYLIEFVKNAAQALARMEPFDRAMTLAAHAFTSLFPLVIVLATDLLPEDSGSLGDRLADNLSLPVSTRAVLTSAFSHDPQPQRATFGVVSLLVVLVSATSFARALARMYAKVWQVRPSGWTGGWRWIAVIVGVAGCTLLLQTAHRAAAGQLDETVGALLLTLLANGLLWTWVPWLLLARRVTWQRLLPGGFLMGVSSVAMFLASRVYMPRAMVKAARDFGAFGVAFTYIGWLFVVCFVLIATTVIGAVLVNGHAARGDAPHTSAQDLRST
jgi:membrane protein